MKKNLIYVALLLAGFAISCGDEFQDVPAVGALAGETLENETGLTLLLTSVYSALDGVRNNASGNGFGISGDNWVYDVIADDAHKGSTDGDQADLFQVETNDWQTSNGYWLSRWTSLYSGVNRANAVLSVANNIDIASLSTDEAAGVNSRIAEARFLRAYFYFDLIRIFGNPAIISVENFDAQEFNQPNFEGSPVASITDSAAWAQVEADLQFAIDNLPATRADQSDPGRPTAVVARAFMGKAHLYQEEWSDALTQLTAVINSGEFALNENYLDNFNAAGENGPESVFAIQFAADGGFSLDGNQGSTLNFPGGGPFGSCCGFYQPSIDLANAFQVDASGLPLIDTFNNSDFLNDYGINTDEAFTPDTTSPVDPRLDYTVGRRGIDYNGFGEHIGAEWIRATFDDISGPYLPKKNVYQADELGVNQGTGVWGQQHSGVNYNIMRYADVLLMAAEAAAETSDLTTALTLVNQVRTRAASTPQVQAVDGSGPAANYQVGTYPSFADQAAAIAAVRFERRIELGMEGHRLFDLRRWGVSAQVMTAYYANETRTIANFGPKVRPYDASRQDLVPIPLDAIGQSGDILGQNPGY